jgi:hypothetical protein
MSAFAPLAFSLGAQLLVAQIVCAIGAPLKVG